MKRVKQIITVLLSLCLMFVIMLICLLSSLPTFLMPKTYHEALEQVNAYTLIQESIQNSLDDLLLINNISRDTLSEFVTVGEVKQVVSQDVDALLAWLNGTGPQLSALEISQYEARFDERMTTFFRDNQYYLDDAEKQDVEVMKQSAMNMIHGNLRMLDFDVITQTIPFTVIPKLIQLVDINLIVMGLGVISVIISTILLIMSRRQITEALLWIGNSILTGGLIIFTLFFSGIQSGFYKHIAIQVTYLRQAIGLLIEEWFTTLYRFGLIAIGIGVLLLLPYWIKAYKDCMRD
ncbi:MAG: hypothetical protein Q3980_04985 [Turicibacter sp.]|nr:hypothetical protein [Turicibacter sp.]